jgi:glycolate oxidase iron-sulfur subunit
LNTSERTELHAYYDETLKCVRCGLCQGVCPVFGAERTESAVARGKVQIVRALLEDRLEPTSPLRERIFLCLNCEACEANCPSGVAVSDVILAARAQLRQELGQPALERLVLRNVLARSERMELGGAALALYQNTGLRWLAQKTHILGLLPGQMGAKEQMLPNDLSLAPARKKLPAVSGPANHKYRVAYFLGCVTSIMYQRVAASVLEVLHRNGCQVLIPSRLSCCGLPHRNYGDRETAAQLEEENTRQMNEVQVDAIVTDCATCGSALRGYKGLKAPVYDVNDFLVGQVGLATPSQPLQAKVTYHDPCHLVRGQGVRATPRQLLQSIPEVDFVEMAESDRCCGGAGTFALLHYDESMRILDRKIGHAADTGAEIVATGCPACNMQISHGLARHESQRDDQPLPREVAHPVELLARAYSGRRPR